jgi:hypothetical protein
VKNDNTWFCTDGKCKKDYGTRAHLARHAKSDHNGLRLAEGKDTATNLKKLIDFAIEGTSLEGNYVGFSNEANAAQYATRGGIDNSVLSTSAQSLPGSLIFQAMGPEPPLGRDDFNPDVAPANMGFQYMNSATSWTPNQNASLSQNAYTEHVQTLPQSYAFGGDSSFTPEVVDQYHQAQASPSPQMQMGQSSLYNQPATLNYIQSPANLTTSSQNNPLMDQSHHHHAQLLHQHQHPQLFTDPEPSPHDLDYD